MAALQKIRSKGVLLVIVIGLALFAFIAEEFVRSIQTTWTQHRQQVGSVYGENISTQDFQEAYSEYEEAYKFMQGVSTISERESNQLKDQVWQSLVFDKLVSHEAELLGLTVTDGELQQLFNEGTSTLLRSTPFYDQQTGRFSATQLKSFLSQYQQIQSGTSQIPEEYQEQYLQLYDYWQFIEKSLRRQLLQQKYQTLLLGCVISNPVEAEMKSKGTNLKSSLLVVGLPYTSINDNYVKVSDADVKALYGERKEEYKQIIETRDIKYVTFHVEASDDDKAALQTEMEEIAASMATGENLVSVVRNANSEVVYSDVWVTKDALPVDIQEQLDSLAPGQQKGPYYCEEDNSLNIIKYVARIDAPDTVRYRQIGVGGETVEKARERADSVMGALRGGAPFDSVARIYGQTGAEAKLYTAQYETAVITSDDDLKFLNQLNVLPEGSVTNIELSQASLIVEILGRDNIVPKYNVAVVKRPYTFSKDTYSRAYNNFSKFVASSKTVSDIEKNAVEYGFKVQTRADMPSTEHYVAGISGTGDALRWVFGAKEGEVSPLYECGESDYLLLVALTKIHPVGYRAFDDVKDELRADALNDKKAVKLEAKLKGAGSIDKAAALAGATVDSMRNVGYSGIAFLPKAGSMETAINGSIWGKKKGDYVGPVKGQSGVYVYQILSQEDTTGKADVKALQSTVAQSHMRAVTQMYPSDLYLDGKVKDERYKFF